MRLRALRGQRLFPLPGAPAFALTAPAHLYLSFVLTLSTEPGVAIFHAQAYIPTEPAQAKQEAWISHAHENPGRQKGDFPPPRQGTEACIREARIPRIALPVPLSFTVEKPDFVPPCQRLAAALAMEPLRNTMPAGKKAGFPRTLRLLRHADFERVYKQGRRHFSASMTVFYWPRPETALGKETPRNTRFGAAVSPGLRVGFTVGRVLGGAVQRNRMKRRLREAVRMTRPRTAMAVDVVINPRKSLLAADFADVRNEVKRAFEVIEQKLSVKPDLRAQAPGPHQS